MEEPIPEPGGQRPNEAQIAAFIERGEESGCLELSEINELVGALGVDDLLGPGPEQSALLSRAILLRVIPCSS